MNLSDRCSILLIRQGSGHTILQGIMITPLSPVLKKRLPLKMPSKEGYYSFRINDFRLIMLNGNEISTYGPGKKADIEKLQRLYNFSEK